MYVCMYVCMYNHPAYLGAKSNWLQDTAALVIAPAAEPAAISRDVSAAESWVPEREQ